LSGEVREWRLSTRLLDILDGLAGREHWHVMETRGLRDDFAAINQIWVVALAQEGEFEHGMSEFRRHQVMVVCEGLPSACRAWVTSQQAIGL